MNGFVNIVDGFSQVAIDELKEQAETLYGGDGTEWLEATATLSTLASVVSGVTVPTKITVSNGTHSSDITLSGNTDKVWVIADTAQAVVQKKLLNIDGDDIKVEGFYFDGGTQNQNDGGGIIVNGDRAEITRCEWNDSKLRKWLRVNEYAYDCSISYCLFKDKYVNQDDASGGSAFYQVIQTRFDYLDGTPHNHKIFRNHFTNILKGTNSNSYECIQPYTVEDGETASVNGADQNTIIEYNLFDDVNGEGEIISNKCNSSTINYNTFNNCLGGLTLRWGNGSEVIGNTMIGGNAGVILSGKYHKILNNHVRNMNNEGILIREGADGMDGYGTPEGVEIAFNTCANCGDGALRIGKSTSSPRYSITTTTITDNVLLQESGILVNITSPNSDSEVLEGITFDTNMYQGSLDGSLPSGGFINDDPELVTQSNGIYAPTSTSPVLASASTNSPEATTDLYLKTRPVSRAIGSVEDIVLSGGRNPVLTSSDVGVDA